MCFAQGILHMITRMNQSNHKRISRTEYLFFTRGLDLVCGSHFVTANSFEGHTDVFTMMVARATMVAPATNGRNATKSDMRAKGHVPTMGPVRHPSQGRS